MTADVRLPPGVRDFLPAAAATRRQIAGALLERFERWGYQRVITPQFECADVLERGLGDEGRREALRFVEPESGEIVALRPDITPQIARIAATRMADIAGPLRLCYEGSVIRRTGGARIQREILQAGVELLGAASPAGDGETAALAAEVLEWTGVSPRRLEIGHVGPARALVDGLDDPELSAALSERLARRDLSGADVLARRLDGDAPVLARLARTLPRLAGSIDHIREVAAAAEIAAITEPALREIESVLAAASEQAPEAIDAVEVSVDLGEVAGHPYYTGIRLAGWLAGVGSAVLVGGRYDQLVARYGGDREATGFAVDVELVAQARAGTGPVARGVLVSAESAGARERARAVTAALRRRGFCAALELGGLRGRRKLRTYAAQSGFERILLVGADRATLLELDGSLIPISGNALRQTLRGKPGKLDGLLCRD